MKLGRVARVLRRSLERRGVVGTLRLIAERASPASRRAARTERAFDEQYEIDTAGSISLGALELEGESYRLGRGYQGSSPEAFRTQLSALHIDHRDFVFVDIGSGKGRALLLAAEFPFKRIVGVELSEELNEVARTNIERYSNPHQQCTAIEVVTADATRFELPKDPLVLYLYAPFDVPLMTELMESTKRSLAASPRPLFVVYAGEPRILHPIEEAGFTRIATHSGPGFAATNEYATFVWPGAS